MCSGRVQGSFAAVLCSVRFHQSCAAVVCIGCAQWLCTNTWCGGGHSRLVGKFIALTVVDLSFEAQCALGTFLDLGRVLNYLRRLCTYCNAKLIVLANKKQVIF